MMKPTSVAVAAMLLVAIAGSAAAQSEYPDRTVRFINSGGAANTAARILAEKMTESLGKPFVVEVVPGAGGILAATRVAKSTPDGYTIYMAGEAAMTTNVALYEKLPYHPLKDFAPVTLAVDSVNILAVHPSLPVKSVHELVALAKAQPGKLTFAGPGIGTSPHIAGELLNSMAGIDILHVPYREANAVIPDLLAGRVSMYFGNIASLLSLVRDGQLRALAVTSLKRVPLVPELPTIAESGYPGYHATTWVGIVAPAGTPNAIVDKLNQAVVSAMKLPDVQKRFADLGLIIVGSTPEEMRQQIADDIPRKIKIVTAAGIKPQ
jgi:tripartite-type tricarboxylate transporter receptor subunit TctC